MKLCKCIFIIIATCSLLLFVTISAEITNSTSSTSSLGKVIIDVDAGPDDALALLLALASEKIDNNGLEVLAVTCTYGNTVLENVITNVRKTLTVANRSDISIYAGAAKPLIQKYTPDKYFGEDGLGDFDFEDEITAQLNKSEQAALIMVSLVQQYPGEVTILALGPLTNLALAMSLDATFADHVKQLYIMGSSVANRGNIQSNLEFNFSLDPESNFIVLNATTSSRSVLCPWETNLKLPITRDWRENVLGSLNSKAIKFLNKAERISITYSTNWYSADTVCVASLLWPEFIRELTVTNTYPVIDGSARGSVIVDYTYSSGRPNNTDIVQLVDMELLKNILLKYLGGE
ncbi:probable uridine nucleosidase 2 isoform X2 [Cephus cinctus]|uniref:Probable uridine nucleosidase 2 isoform X2 n=1 Tax=Cephus cinctus TaxID=211228 RepID=A0AAJ7RMH2_CEPCN|nr:probable uridine nucleosidase 2 isoform X2 [Cephus cinctus]